jgi:hypothetical protein
MTPVMFAVLLVLSGVDHHGYSLMSEVAWLTAGVSDRAGDAVPEPATTARGRLQAHLLTEGAGIPFVVALTGSNRNDITQPLPRLDSTPDRLGTTRRHPRGVPRPGHLRHHVPTRPTTVSGTL